MAKSTRDLAPVAFDDDLDLTTLVARPNATPPGRPARPTEYMPFTEPLTLKELVKGLVRWHERTDRPAGSLYLPAGVELPPKMEPPLTDLQIRPARGRNWAVGD